MMMKYGSDIHASQEEKYDFIISIASGQKNIDLIKEWIHSHLKK